MPLTVGVFCDSPNSFYREKPHPFATAMAEFLVESGMRANRPSVVQAMMSGSNAKYEENIRIMDKLATESECQPTSFASI